MLGPRSRDVLPTGAGGAPAGSGQIVESADGTRAVEHLRAPVFLIVRLQMKIDTRTEWFLPHLLESASLSAIGTRCYFTAASSLEHFAIVAG